MYLYLLVHMVLRCLSINDLNIDMPWFVPVCVPEDFHLDCSEREVCWRLWDIKNRFKHLILKGSGSIAHYISCSCSIMRQFPHDGSTSLPSDFMLSLIIWWNVWVENQDIHDHEKQGPLEKWTEHFKFACSGEDSIFIITFHKVLLQIVIVRLCKFRESSNELVFGSSRLVHFVTWIWVSSFHFSKGPCVKAVDDSSNHRHYLLTFMTSICHENSTGGSDGSSSQKSICPPSIVLLAG